MKTADRMHPITVVVLALAILLTVPFGIMAIHEAKIAVFWRDNAYLFQLNLRDCAICVSALFVPWATFLLLHLLRRKPKWLFYSVLVLGIVTGAVLEMWVAAICFMERLHLGL